MLNFDNDYDCRFAFGSACAQLYQPFPLTTNCATTSMEPGVLKSSLLMVTLLLTFSTTFAQDDVCSGDSCNCQLSNIQALGQLIQDLVANTTRANTGVTYVRWGKSSCPTTPGTELVYAGRAGGNFWSIPGGGSDKLCLPDDPDYLPSTTGLNTAIPSSPHVYGAEYEFLAGPNVNVNQHNVPCAVCFASARGSTLMIPAKTECPSTWTREYYGYLTAERATHRRSVFSCVDVAPETIGNSAGNTNGALFYYVLTTCNGITCPPYGAERALSCVVCTK